MSHRPQGKKSILCKRLNSSTSLYKNQKLHERHSEESDKTSHGLRESMQTTHLTRAFLPGLWVLNSENTQFCFKRDKKIGKHFTKDDTANKNVKSYSRTLVIRDTQNKDAVRRCRTVREASSGLRKYSGEKRTRPAALDRAQSFLRGSPLQGDGATAEPGGNCPSLWLCWSPGWTLVLSIYGAKGIVVRSRGPLHTSHVYQLPKGGPSLHHFREE